MASITSAKCRICRRRGEKLFLRGERCSSVKCAIIKRNYPPGAHGQKGRRPLSGYGLQLKEKQKAKAMYGLFEKQFRNYYLKAKTKKGDTGQFIMSLLEKRLDNIVYRSGIASSRREARQLVGHNHFKVNDKNVNIPSYQLRVGDIVSVKENKIEKSKVWPEKIKALAKKQAPAWLEVNKEKLQVKVVTEPEAKDFEQSIDINQIIEFYSK